MKKDEREWKRKVLTIGLLGVLLVVNADEQRDDAPIKGRSINEGEAAAERINNDSEEIARVLTSMDAATVLAEGIDVPTDIGSIPTAEVARIHAEEELQGMIDNLDKSNETIA
nr:hypothetical protein [Tanacetum cinerariifolium]